MVTSLDSLNMSQQAHILAIAGRLLSMWMASGKTDVPTGYSSLRQLAIEVALESYDFHALLIGDE